jgi:hypothetical protein
MLLLLNGNEHGRIFFGGTMAKKKYSINWENELPVSFEVNGVEYETLDDVPGEADRRRLKSMLEFSSEDDVEDVDFNDEEFKRLRKDVEQISKFPVEKVILWIFSGVAGIMLFVAGISSFNAIAKISSESDAPGRVVDMIERREYVNEQDRIVEEYYYPVVEYVSDDGSLHTVQLSEGSNPASYEIGDAVTILYDPEHPLEARIKSFGSSALMWVLPGITGILGVAFLVAVLVVWKVMLPERDE